MKKEKSLHIGSRHPSAKPASLLPQVLVIAHDAGGAEIIAAHIRARRDKNEFHVYAAGPAVKIFQREGITISRVTKERRVIALVIDQHLDVSYALFGSGWMTKIESTALLLARMKGLKSVVYLESWSNFRERFGYPEKNWRDRLPDQIWVGDRPALLLAKKFFPKISVRYMPNQYFRAVKERYTKEKLGSARPHGVLFLSDAVAGMEEIFGELLANLPRQKAPHHIRLRFHPADDHTRYDDLIKHYARTVIIEKSKEKDIVRDFLSAKVVIGTETVAMVLSVLCGIRTISITLLGKQKAPLPFEDIIRVRNAKSAARLI